MSNFIFLLKIYLKRLRISFMRKPIRICNSVIWGQKFCSKTLVNMKATRTLSLLKKPKGNTPSLHLVLYFITSQGCDYLFHFHVGMFWSRHQHVSSQRAHVRLCVYHWFPTVTSTALCIYSSLMFLNTHSEIARRDQFGKRKSIGRSY